MDLSLRAANAKPRSEPARVAFDDIPALAGRIYRSDPFMIDVEETSVFETLTYFRPLDDAETSEEVAAGLIEGFHSLALIDALFNEHLRFDRRECYVLNYGVDRVRFPAQLTVEKRLTSDMRIADVSPRGEAWLVTIDVEVGEEGAEKPGLVAAWKLFVARRRGYRAVR